MECKQCGKEKEPESFFRVKRDVLEQPCKKCWHENEAKVEIPSRKAIPQHKN